MRHQVNFSGLWIALFAFLPLFALTSCDKDNPVMQNVDPDPPTDFSRFFGTYMVDDQCMGSVYYITLSRSDHSENGIQISNLAELGSNQLAAEVKNNHFTMREQVVTTDDAQTHISARGYIVGKSVYIDYSYRTSGINVSRNFHCSVEGSQL